MRRADREDVDRDAGFTLVEVVVALVVLSTMMAAVAALFISSIETASGLQRRQAAAGLATQALDLARATGVQADTAGCTPLLRGRGQAAVTAQWATAPAALTTTADPEATPASCPGSALVPLQGLPTNTGLSDPVRLSGVPYTVRTYIGSCRMTPDNPCVKATSGNSNQPRYYRVVAVVSWSGAGCQGGPCTFSASTLLDPSTDPVFNLRGAATPVATNDTVCLPTPTASAVNVIGNDAGSLTRTPVTVVTRPSRGTLSATISTGVGSYAPGTTTPPFTDTFTYTLTDVNGVVSAPATVTVRVGGC